MTDTAKRPRGRPRTQPGNEPRTVETTLDPELHAAWKRDGRPLNAILRAVLLG